MNTQPQSIPSTTQATLVKDTLVFEASEIGWRPGQPAPTRIQVLSDSTNEVYDFWFDYADRNTDGAITGWRYGNCSIPITVLVIND